MPRRKLYQNLKTKMVSFEYTLPKVSVTAEKLEFILAYRLDWDSEVQANIKKITKTRILELFEDWVMDKGYFGDESWEADRISYEPNDVKRLQSQAKEIIQKRFPELYLEHYNLDENNNIMHPHA